MSQSPATSEPRRIGIFLANLGGAHQSVAAALRESFLAQEPDLKVDLIEVFRQCSVFPLTTSPKAYNLLTTRWPFLWRILYYVTNSPRRFYLGESLARPFLQPKLNRCVAAQPYDALVNVFPGFGRSLARARRLLPGRPPLITVVIDLVTLHPAWVCREVDWYIVPTNEARQACVHYGIPASQVHVLGLPIQKEFVQSQLQREDARLSLGLDPDRFTVLIMGGGEGAGRMANLARVLTGAGQALQLLVVAGRNEKLLRTLQSSHRQLCMRVFGYVDDMVTLMAAADLVVTKAGPCTIAESIACQRPLFITDHLPQEAGNVSFVCQNGLGWSLRDMEAIRRKILSLATGDGKELKQMQQNAAKLAWYHAADDIAAWVLTRMS